VGQCFAADLEVSRASGRRHLTPTAFSAFFAFAVTLFGDETRGGSIFSHKCNVQFSLPLSLVPLFPPTILSSLTENVVPRSLRCTRCYSRIFGIRNLARLPLWLSEGSGREFGWLACIVSCRCPPPPPGVRLLSFRHRGTCLTCGGVIGFAWSKHTFTPASFFFRIGVRFFWSLIVR
jgi:hypothetical protein